MTCAATLGDLPAAGTYRLLLLPRGAKAGLEIPSINYLRHLYACFAFSETSAGASDLSSMSEYVVMALRFRCND